MGRHSPGRSYGHWIKWCFHDCYDIGWTVDRYVRGSRLRFPTSYERETDYAGAVRFAKKWGLAEPKPGA